MHAYPSHGFTEWQGSHLELLAIRTIQEHVKRYKEIFPEASHEILRKTCVDDFALGRDGVRDILKLQQSTSDLMQQAGFNLTKWSSNLSLAEKMFDPIGLITLLR